MFFRQLLFVCGLIFTVGVPFGYTQQKIDDFFLSNFGQEGKRDWEIVGSYALIYPEYSQIYKVKALNFRQDNVVTIRANQAKVSADRTKASLSDNVKIFDQKKRAFFTDSLNWDELSQIAQTDSSVKVCAENLRIRATGMIIYGREEKADFLKNVRVDILNSVHNDKITVTCDGPLIVEQVRGKALFNNNVVMHSIDGDVYSQRAVAFFDKKNSQIVKIISEGQVRLEKDGQFTISERAVYLARLAKVVLSGKPKIVYFP